MRHVASIVAVALVLALLLSGCIERSMLYPARYRTRPEALRLPPSARELTVLHEQGRTHANLFLGRGVSAADPGPVVLYAHGNGELIEQFPNGLPGYARLGLSVAVIEYRGCGRSDGSPSKARIDADFVAFYDRIATLPEVDPERIVFHGRSLGGGIVASLSRARPPAALVLESTFSGTEDFAARWRLPRFLVREKYDVTAALRAYPGPVMIVHSPGDEVIPFEMAEKNLAARPDAVFHRYSLGHNDPMPPRFFTDVADFLAGAGILP